MTAGTSPGKCPFCGATIQRKTLAIIGFGSKTIPIPCECDGAKADREAKEAKRVEAERAEVFRERWSTCGIPPEFLGVEADFSMRDKIADNRSVYITGQNGRGKTYKACQYAKAFLIGHIVPIEGIMTCVKTVRFVTSQQVSSQLKSSWQKWGETEEDVFQRLIGVDLLVLDDLGKGVPSEWFAENLFRLIDERWSHKKPMVITSQYSTTDLADRLCKADEATLDAMKSRLRGWCEGIVLEGPDRRMQR